MREARRGGQLVTLEDAGRYITKLPKAEHEAAEWQAAMEALILVASQGGATMFARIGFMRALSRHVRSARRKTAFSITVLIPRCDCQRNGPSAGQLR
jgi:hypothetical protein